MDQKYRSIIYKFPHLHQLCRMIVDANDNRYFKSLNHEYHFDRQIELLKGTRQGRRCFVVGNGPSLNSDDLDLIKDEDSFSSNHIYKVFEQTDWRPRYYFLQDRYAKLDIELADMEVKYKFISDYYWRTHELKDSQAICFHGIRFFGDGNLPFSEDASKGIVIHHTVTYSMLQMAIYLGYKRIYLLGVDHNYASTYDSDGKIEISNFPIRSHFYEDDRPKEIIANIEGMNEAYAAAKRYADNNGVSIVNCTRGGHLECFPREDLNKVMKNAT